MQQGNDRQVTFQIVCILSQIDAPGPTNEALIGPNERIGVRVLALMSPQSQSLPIVLHDPQQMDAVDYGGLVELPSNSQVLFQLFFAQMLQHSRVHHIGSEIV